MSAMAGWQQWEDGGSGTWLWLRRIGGLRYLFIRIESAVDICGRDAETWFWGDLRLVDLEDIPLETQADAVRGCGPDELSPDPEFVAWACLQHGAASPLFSDDSGSRPEGSEPWNVPSEDWPGFIRLRARVRREAERFLAGDESALDRIVNKLGQTAREFARGTAGLWDRLRAIQVDSDATPEQKLILRMYQNAGQTLGAGPVPEDLRHG
jgi:hypothetical protein